MYSLKYKVTTSTCDSEGKLKLYSALQMMQDCSEMWIDSEPGVKQFFTEQNMAQLLATRQVEIIRVPQYKEELTVTTSVYGMKPMFGFRNTFIYDAQGNPCYKTWSMGAFVDKAVGKLKRVDDATIQSMTLEPQLEMNRHRLQQASEQCQLCPHGNGVVARRFRRKRFASRVPSGSQVW